MILPAWIDRLVRRFCSHKLPPPNQLQGSPAPRADALSDQINTAAAILPYGTYSKIARDLDVTPQHVRRVAVGLTTSKRVSAAIEKEWKRLHHGPQAAKGSRREVKSA